MFTDSRLMLWIWFDIYSSSSALMLTDSSLQEMQSVCLVGRGDES